MRLEIIKHRIWPAVALCILLFFYAPLVIYWSNSTDLTYDYFDVLRYMIPVGIAIFAVLILVYLIIFSISKKIGVVLTLLITAALVCTYIQGDWLAFTLPTLDGSEIIWENYDVQRYYSISIWVIALASVAIAASKLEQEKSLHICNLISKLLIALMFLSIVITAIGVPGRFYRKKAFFVSNREMLTLSEDKNLVILLLDCIDTENFNEVLTESDRKDVFQDFTFYQNTFSGYDATMRCVPQMLIGDWFENGEMFQAYIERELPNSLLISTLSENGYRIGMYDENFAAPLAKEGITENTESANEFIYPGKFVKMLIKLTGLRYAPYDFKKLCVLSLDDLYVDSLKGTDAEDSFSYNNARVFDYLSNNPVKISDEKCFRFIHIQGGHPPYTFNENCEEIPYTEGSYQLNIRSAITLTKLYLDKMKEAGVYDNSVILVLADHGLENNGDKLNRYNPIMLIKGIGEHHEMMYSDAPIAHKDLSEAYIKLLNGSSSTQIFDVGENSDRPRRHFCYIENYEENMEEYYQYGYANEKDTFISTGNIYKLNVG